MVMVLLPLLPYIFDDSKHVHFVFFLSSMDRMIEVTGILILHTSSTNMRMSVLFGFNFSMLEYFLFLRFVHSMIEMALRANTNTHTTRQQQVISFSSQHFHFLFQYILQYFSGAVSMPITPYEFCSGSEHTYGIALFIHSQRNRLKLH